MGEEREENVDKDLVDSRSTGRRGRGGGERKEGREEDK